MNISKSLFFYIIAIFTAATQISASGLWNGDGIKYGSMSLTSPNTVTLTTAGQYYKITGTWSAGNFLRGWSLTAAGVLKNESPSKIYHLTGVSDLAVNKACTLTYALYINGQLVSGATTPHTFAATTKIETISIAAIVQINSGDEIEVYAKSDTAATDLTPATLRVILVSLN